MNRLFQTFALISLIVLLIGCSPSGTNIGQAARIAPTSEPNVEAQARTDTPSPPPTATDTPPPPTTPTVAPPTMAPEPTETDAPPQVVAPSATPLVVLTAGDVLRISLAEARALLDSGQAVLYDTRSAAQYRAAHAAGAISFPETEASARFDELPTDQALIFYCT